jgi:elongation factor G
MATPSAGDLRNFAIVGHASSGKTTLSEAMLACAGVIGRMGNIAQGTTVSDYHVSEKQHQISTQTSLLHCTKTAGRGSSCVRARNSRPPYLPV